MTEDTTKMNYPHAVIARNMCVLVNELTILSFLITKYSKHTLHDSRPDHATFSLTQWRQRIPPYTHLEWKQRDKKLVIEIRKENEAMQNKSHF